MKRWGRFVKSPPDISSFFEVVTLPVGLHPFLPAYLTGDSTFSFSDKHTQQCEVKLHVLTVRSTGNGLVHINREKKTEVSDK